MNERAARAAEFGRNYALIGAFGACLLGALTIPVDGQHDDLTTVSQLTDIGLETPSAAGFALPADWKTVEIDIPLPVEPPPIELTIAMLPTLELAVAELPMIDAPSLDLTAGEWEPASLDSAANDDEPRTMHGRLSVAAGPLRRQVTSMRVSDTNELARLFRAHDYTLDQARRGEPVPALQIDRVPGDLVNVKDGNERKALFIKTLLPIVLESNERIQADRTHLQRLYERHATNRSLSVIERMWLAEVADRYGAESTDFIELLRRVDIIPPSMAIAQAGVESGWGTSYAARVGNSLFGQIRAGSRQVPVSFSSVGESVEAYFINLNTHFAYSGFRAERARLRAGGKDPDGYHLIGQLLRYSELGNSYINFVRAVIRENRLTDFDGAKLPPI